MENRGKTGKSYEEMEGKEGVKEEHHGDTISIIRFHEVFISN